MRNYFLGALALALSLSVVIVFCFSQVQAYSGPFLLAVVRGTDGGIYYNTYTTSWGSWASLSGSTNTAPTLCQAVGFSGAATTELLVRGTDNGIYRKEYTTTTGWTSSWDSPGGQTIDQPACALLFDGAATNLFVVVRGTDNGLYFNHIRVNCGGCGSWAGWVSLGGTTNSAPILVATSDTDLDLFVRGTDNGIYHKGAALTEGPPIAINWASSWDSPGGSTLASPSAVSFLGSYEAHVVVRGTDSGIYQNLASDTDTNKVSWGSWSKIPGATLYEPGLAGECQAFEALVVVGTDQAIYGTGDFLGFPSFVGAGGGTDFSPGVSTLNNPGGNSYHTAAVLVTGTDDGIYFNTLSGTSGPGSWSGWVSVGGASDEAPALANLFC
jgi:hypothetical protein